MSAKIDVFRLNLALCAGVLILAAFVAKTCTVDAESVGAHWTRTDHSLRRVRHEHD